MSVVEPATGGGGPNRMFIVLALGLVGLLILATIVLLGIVFIPRIFGTTALLTATPSRVAVTFTTPTRAALLVFTPTALPSDTPAATLVNPPVTSPATLVAGGAVTSTTGISGTVTLGTGTPGSGMPQTGIGEDLLLLAGGIVLVFVIIAARRARSTMAV